MTTFRYVIGRVPRRPLLGAALALLLALAVAPTAALAHERRDVAGYAFIVGFSVEPAFDGFKNGVDLRISRDNQPVTGAEQDLKVDVTYVPSNTTKTIALRAVFGTAGAYTVDLIPTMPGQYRFRFHGTISGTAIDATFESGPNTFSDVGSQTTVQFPKTVIQGQELTASIRGATDTAVAAKDSASGARTVATVALVVGVLGLIAGGGAAAMALRRR